MTSLISLVSHRRSGDQGRQELRRRWRSGRPVIRDLWHPAILRRTVCLSPMSSPSAPTRCAQPRSLTCRSSSGSSASWPRTRSSSTRSSPPSRCWPSSCSARVRRPRWSSPTWTARPWASRCSSTTSRRSSAGPGCSSRISTSSRTRAGWASARRCCATWRAWPWRAAAAAWTGTCWTGMRPPSASTRSWAPTCCPTGGRAG